MPRSAVPTVGDLEARIDEAVVIARASEEGVREIGEMAIDAARQARRAAEAAEGARVAAEQAASRPEPAGPDGGAVEEPPSREVVIDPLERFNRRADAIAARLEKLQSV